MNRRTLTWAALGLGALLVCWLLLPQNPTVLGWADSPVPTPTATQATSPEWVNFYGMSSTLDGQPLPIGAVVEAWTGGVRCGFFTVHTIGMYGLLPCYRSYEGSPGANPGDVISFTINGRPATPMGPDQPVWTSHGDADAAPCPHGHEYTDCSDAYWYSGSFTYLDAHHAWADGQRNLAASAHLDALATACTHVDALATSAHVAALASHAYSYPPALLGGRD